MSITAISYAANAYTRNISTRSTNNTGALTSNTGANNASPAVNVGISADARIAGFRDWEAGYLQSGIGEDRKQQLQQYASSFEDIITKATARNGYENPQAFVASLSPEELKTLQVIQSLSDPINPCGLSQEGALNLLNTPGQVQDINQDGVEEVGIAKTRIFPPPDAPASVKQAWAQTTAGMSTGDKLIMEFMAINQASTTDAAGNTQFTYLGAQTDYGKLIQNLIDSLTATKESETSQQRAITQKVIENFNRFLGYLNPSQIS